ncbi:hypothetical protein IPM62_01700 [Candidatus Woesebacteria bacterium]|nr:MAG: hypothetical protein IPM62_01700 [Candidatus Woesebacteria bacterium]
MSEITKFVIGTRFVQDRFAEIRRARETEDTWIRAVDGEYGIHKNRINAGKMMQEELRSVEKWTRS